MREEVGGLLGTRYLLREKLIRGDFGIVAEPTGSRIEIATKGVLHLEVTTKGRMAHGGKPWAGINAIEHMGRLIAELNGLRERLGRRQHRLVGKPSITVGTIAGGTVPNMVASDCRLVLDRRVIPGESAVDAQAEVQAILDRLSAEDPTFSATLRTLLDFPSVEVPSDLPVVGALSRAITEVTGCAPEIGGKDGGTDAAWIYQATGIPMVHFSPGESRYVLAANERVELEAYMRAVETFVLTFEDLLGVAT